MSELPYDNSFTFSNYREREVRIEQQDAVLLLCKEALEAGIEYCERAIDYFSPAPTQKLREALDAIKALEGA